MEVRRIIRPGWQHELLFLLNIVSISRRASTVTAMIVQLYFDRQRRVFGILFTRSPHSYWCMVGGGGPAFSSYLTYSPPIIVTVDHGVNGNASLLSNIKLIILPIFSTYFSRVKREFLKWAFAATKMFLRWERTLVLELKIFYFSDLSTHNWTVWPVCPQCEESEETWCGKAFKTGAAGWPLIFFSFSFLLTV